MEFEKILKLPAVEEMYQNHLAVWRRNGDYPFLNYFGVNFDKTGICSVKFYIHIFHPITLKDTQVFLPNSEDFFRYYHLYSQENICTHENTGVAFELKFKDSLSPTYGFHYRLKVGEEAAAIIPKPKKLPFDIDTISTQLGINYEYTGEKKLIKYYYSLTKAEYLHFFADKLRLPFIESIDIAEYAESKDFSKINCQRSDHSLENMKRPNLLSKKNQNTVQQICEKYNVVNILDGYYLDKNISSVYFTARSYEQKSSNTIHYFCDTLRLLLSSQNK